MLRIGGFVAASRLMLRIGGFVAASRLMLRIGGAVQAHQRGTDGDAGHGFARLGDVHRGRQFRGAHR
jgi:hypothetical protein